MTARRLTIPTLLALAATPTSFGCSRPPEVRADPRASAIVDAGGEGPMPKDLVLVLTRLVHPIDGELQREIAEVTAHGACSPATECATVSEATLADLWRRFTLATGARTDPSPVSPHSVCRQITARWTGGSRAVSDGCGAYIAAEDEPKFDASYNAVMGAVLAHRVDAGAP